MERGGYTYIMANEYNTVLYVGVTSDLKIRMQQHKEMSFQGFTKKHKISKLVYYEVFSLIEDSIYREKQLKAGSRMIKIELIMRNNPGFVDLTEDINFE